MDARDFEHIHAHAKRRLVTRGTTPVDPDILAADENLVTNETNDRILTNSDNDALREAVNRLPPAYRQSILLHYFSEMPIKDIAVLLKVPIGTIFWRLNVARKMLAKDLAVKLGKKKPLAVLFAVLLGIGTLFGAYQVVETILASPTPTPTTTPLPSPSTLTSSSPIPTTLTTQQEKPAMNIKTLLAAPLLVTTLTTSAAVDVTPFIPEGVTPETPSAGVYTYEYDNDRIVIFADPGNYEFTVPEGASAISYLVVGGGGSGVVIIRYALPSAGVVFMIY